MDKGFTPDYILNVSFDEKLFLIAKMQKDKELMAEKAKHGIMF